MRAARFPLFTFYSRRDNVRVLMHSQVHRYLFVCRLITQREGDMIVIAVIPTTAC